MSTLWSSHAETGILRKNDQKDKLEDLLVFGYACKLFRDDQKALEIDQGKHLIPWMGDNTLKIDRYDGRGALSDLSSCEASKEGYDAMRWLGLSETERHIEQLCDEERYYSLKNDDEEDELYKEEEKKRLQNHGQVQYSYDVPQKPEGPTLPPEEDDEPFIPSPELDVPVNMTLPTTVKQNARIEKTALFISKEGPQMEILLKTKQAGNPQFGFLNQDDALYRYYRHVLMAFKTGRLKPSEEKQHSDQEPKREEDHYLHPSLAPSATVTSKSTLTLPSINYKPSANCAYSQLVNRIQGTQPTPEPPVVSDPNNGMNAYSQAYMQFYQQYGYYPQYDQNHPYYAAYMQGMTYEQYQIQYNAYMQAQNQGQAVKQEPNPYAQIVSNVKAKADPAANTKDIISQNGVYPNVYMPTDVNTENTDISIPPVPGTIPQQFISSEPAKKSPNNIFSLAQYSGSESENEDENEDSNAQAVVVPPSDIQIIIDKMASYVAKNGPDFENIVKSKGDPRFIFLEDTHIYNPYYKYKLKECGIGKEKSEVKKPEKEEKEDNVLIQSKQGEKKPVKVKDKKVITPVCFSIKKPKDSDSVTRDKSALPVEDSTDEDEDIKENDLVSTQTEECSISSIEKNEEQPEKESENIPIIEIEDPIMELIDLTEDLEERKDAKRAENRLKDRLAAAAREKLAAKNRALQMERKKRAAAFLSQLNSMNNEITSEQEEVKNTTALTNVSSPEEGEINGDSQNEEISRVIYYVDQKSPVNEKESRSRSSSKSRHKSTRHKRKGYKRSHSHSKKKTKRERRSREHKKSKKRNRSRSRSYSKSPKHRKSEKREMSNEADKKVKSEHSSESSDTESEKTMKE